MNQTEALTCLHLGLKVKPVHWGYAYMSHIETKGEYSYVIIKHISNRNTKQKINLKALSSEGYNYEYELVP